MIGKAGEHIACADLFLSGWVASIAAEGQGYDILAEREGRVIRIAVKSTACARPRRTGARDAYCFHIEKRRPVAPRRLPYTIADADVIALVAVDSRRVGYMPVGCPTLVWVFNEDAAPNERRFGPKVSCMRRFDQISLETALG